MPTIDPIMPLWLLLPGYILAVVISVRFYLKCRKPEKAAQKIFLISLRVMLLTLVLILALKPALNISKKTYIKSKLFILTDTSESMTIKDINHKSRKKAVEEAHSKSEAIYKELEAKYDVRKLDFARKLKQNDQENISQKSTSLSSPLSIISKESSTGRIGGIVILSDGRQNHGASLPRILETMKRKKIKVHTVLTGQHKYSGDIVDAYMKNITCESYIKAKAPLNLTGIITTKGLANRKIKIKYLIDGKVVSTESRIPASQEQTFYLSKQLETDKLAAGFHRMEVIIENTEGELTTKNNKIENFFKIRQDGLKILLIATEPSAEFKFLRRFLENSEDFSTTTPSPFSWRTKSGRAKNSKLKLEEFDLFLFVNTNLKFIPKKFIDSIKRNIKIRKAGSLFIMGGKSTETLKSYPSLLEIIPADLSAAKSELAEFSWTFGNKQHFITEFFPDVKSELKASGALFNKLEGSITLKVKPFPTAQLVTTTADATEKNIFITDNFGKGRIGLMTTNTSWQWRVNEASQKLLYENFWKRTALYLASREDLFNASLSIYSGKTRFDLGDNILLKGDLLNNKGAPVRAANIEVNISKLDKDGKAGKAETYTMISYGDQYKLDYIPPSGGIYAITAKANHDDKEVDSNKLRVMVIEPQVEFEKITASKKTMDKIAEETNGTAVGLKQYPDLLEQLKSQAVVRVVNPIKRGQDIWDNMYTYLIFALLLTLEWAMRRKFGLP